MIPDELTRMFAFDHRVYCRAESVRSDRVVAATAFDTGSSRDMFPEQRGSDTHSYPDGYESDEEIETRNWAGSLFKNLSFTSIIDQHNLRER